MNLPTLKGLLVGLDEKVVRETLERDHPNFSEGLFEAWQNICRTQTDESPSYFIEFAHEEHDYGGGEIERVLYPHGRASPDDHQRYSIIYMPWKTTLASSVRLEDVDDHEPVSALEGAISCLFEMTFLGFDEEQVLRTLAQKPSRRTCDGEEDSPSSKDSDSGDSMREPPV